MVAIIQQTDRIHDPTVLHPHLSPYALTDTLQSFQLDANRSSKSTNLFQYCSNWVQHDWVSETEIKVLFEDYSFKSSLQFMEIVKLW